MVSPVQTRVAAALGPRRRNSLMVHIRPMVHSRASEENMSAAQTWQWQQDSGAPAPRPCYQRACSPCSSCSTTPTNPPTKDAQPPPQSRGGLGAKKAMGDTATALPGASKPATGIQPQPHPHAACMHTAAGCGGTHAQRTARQSTRWAGSQAAFPSRILAPACVSAVQFCHMKSAPNPQLRPERIASIGFATYTAC